MTGASRWEGLFLGIAGAAICGAFVVGCGSDEQGPEAAAKDLKSMMVNGRVVQGEDGMPGARIRFTPLSPGGYGADVAAGAGGKWAWSGPQGRYKIEVLDEGKTVLTKEFDLTKPKNPDILLEVE